MSAPLLPAHTRVSGSAMPGPHRPTGRRLLAAPALTAVLCLLAALAPLPASAQLTPTPAAPFNRSYSVLDLGAPPGVPANYGGLTFRPGTTDRLLIGGQANTSEGALYEIGVTRDAAGHIDGFSGTATRFADAAQNDGGVTEGPGGVLFLARWPVNDVGQTVPGSSITNKIVDLDTFGVTPSPGALQFVPPGQPGAGSFKIASYAGGQWYDADVVPDGSGTYDLANVVEVPGSTISGGPEGIVYVPSGSPLFGAPSLLVSEYSAGAVGAYEVDGDGNPLIGTRRTFISGLSGAEGAFIDPVSGDFLFSTFGGGGRVIVVRGFGGPTTLDDLSDPRFGRTVNVDQLRGRVTVGVRRGRGRGARASQKGVRFVPLREARQIPVGSFLNTRRGTLRLQSARNRRGTRQNGDFSGGLFQVLQSRRGRGLTDIVLKGASFRGCRRAGRGKRASAAQSIRRRLRANTRGRFRTRGRHSAATVRGTVWQTADRCDGTLTRVTRGRVAVRDFRRKRTIVLRAGKSYLARAPR
jgi:hypothetical protein